MSRPLSRLALLALLAGSAGGAQEPTWRGTGTVIGTTGHSEWCATGMVFVDLVSGQYMLTPAADRRVCDNPDLARPVRQGALARGRLELLREAHTEVMRQGLDVPECEDSSRNPPRIVVSNGGDVALAVTGDAYTLVASEDLGCWNSAADKMHEALDRAFED